MVDVSIPDRVLGFFRRANATSSVALAANPVSIPDRVLGFFRLGRHAKS